MPRRPYRPAVTERHDEHLAREAELRDAFKVRRTTGVIVASLFLLLNLLILGAVAPLLLQEVSAVGIILEVPAPRGR